MSKYLVTFLTATALAACGSKSAPAPTTPAEPPSVGRDHDGPATAVAAPAPADPPSLAAPPPADPARDLLAAEAAAWESAKPVFQQACATCHSQAGKKAAKKKLDHFSLDSYPPGGHHTATIGFTIRDVLGLGGKKPTMPYDKPGSVQGDDLAKIKAWTDAWQAAHDAGAHPAASHDHH